ncbi:hypothetical protein ABTM77_20220, partial [Acinetobacter baumannii]
WVRDAAITAIEIAEAQSVLAPAGSDTLADYVRFAKLCQDHATPTLGHACYTVAGQARPWSEQNDGPAIQTIALLRLYDQLDPDTRATAAQII